MTSFLKACFGLGFLALYAIIWLLHLVPQL